MKELLSQSQFLDAFNCAELLDDFSEAIRILKLCKVDYKELIFVADQSGWNYNFVNHLTNKEFLNGVKNEGSKGRQGEKPI